MSAIPPINAVIIPVTPFQQNCTLLWETSSMEGVFIDPGGDVDNLIKACEDNKVKATQIWITHGHLDHAGGAMELARRLGIKIIGPHKDDEFWLNQIKASWKKYGYDIGEDCTPDEWLNEGDKVHLGAFEFDVVHCPGHTPGHVAFVNKGFKLAFVGDLLFQGSIGRTDFPKGNHADLINSITQKLWPYGNDVQFIPGHGPMSTFGQERANNQFVGDKVVGKF
jgi:hydroxyacylglutathione hydrolase